MRKSTNRHKKILLLLFGGIGDVLLFTPALEALRREFPEACIDAIVRNNGGARVLKYNPYINNIIVYDRNSIKRTSGRLKLLRQILRQKYTISITISCDFDYKTGLIALLSGADERIGPNIRHHGIFYNVKVSTPPLNQHFIYRNYDLVKKAGVKEPLNETLRFYLDNEERDFAKDFFERAHLKLGEKIIGIHPGSGHWREERRLPKSKFVKLINILIKEPGIKVILMGGPDEEQLVNEILNETDADVIAANNQMNLGQFGALVERCNLFLCNDGGPLQIAAAVGGTPTITIVGPTNPKAFAPIRKQHLVIRNHLPCAPCIDYYDYDSVGCEEHSCMKSITVSQIIDVIHERL